MTAAVVLTIDGPSGSGKGTIAGRLARQLGWQLLDSGALYRLLALAAQDREVDLDDEAALAALAERLDVSFVPSEGGQGQRILLEGREVEGLIRTERIGAVASRVAAIPAVRQALLQRQRAFQSPPGLIADGRDMGTVVFPEAQLKVFLTASAEERARRRYQQLLAAGEDVTLGSLIDEIRLRDERDTQRSVAPLRPAEDAILLDSTELSIEQVMQHILDELARRGLAG